MITSKMIKSVMRDINRTMDELQKKNLLRDRRGFSQKDIQAGICEITYPGKNSDSSIIYDKHISSAQIIDKLLNGLQYNLLLYDKGIIQAEYMIDKNEIIKERLVFIKGHNKIWDIEEIEEAENREEDWFANEEGIPIMLRVDYAPDEHVDGKHAKTHLTISNHDSCRIPIKGIITFSEFIKFILFHFYNINIDMKEWRLGDETITELEKKMLHINWN